jgi:lysophospholipase L1-like esterase
MQGKLKKLKDSNNQYVYPITHADGVFVESNQTLTQKLAEIGEGTGSTNELQGLVLNALGDSVTQANYNITPNNQPPFVSVTGYVKLLQDIYGMTVRNYGIGGTRITQTDDGNGFCQRYVNMDNNADIITVMGGINDYAYAGNVPIGTFGSTDNLTIYGAMDTLCKGLLQKYPEKRLGFLLPFGFNEYKGAGTWKPYEDAMIQVLEYYAIPYLNLRKESLINANIGFINTAYFNNADKTHPNDAGHRILARKIASFLNTL